MVVEDVQDEVEIRYTKKVDLRPIKEELQKLTELSKKPSDTDVLRLAKRGLIHPYYDPQHQNTISYLQETLERYSNGVNSV